MNGVFLKEGEQVGQVDHETAGRSSIMVEDEREFDATEVERKITAPDSNRKIIEEIQSYAYEHETETAASPRR